MNPEEYSKKVKDLKEGQKQLAKDIAAFEETKKNVENKYNELNAMLKEIENRKVEIDKLTKQIPEPVVKEVIKEVYDERGLLKRMKDFDKREKELDDRRVSLDKRESLLTQKETSVSMSLEVAKNSRQALSKKMEDKVTFLDNRSKALNAEEVSFKKYVHDTEITLSEQQRIVDDKAHELAMKEKDLEKREHVIFNSKKELSDYSAELATKRSGIDAEHSAITYEKKKLDEAKEYVRVKEEGAQLMYIDANNTVARANDILAQAEKDSLEAKRLKHIAEQEQIVFEESLKKVSEQARAQTEYAKELDKRAEEAEQVRMQQAREQRDIKDKLKFIRDWEKKHNLN